MGKPTLVIYEEEKAEELIERKSFQRLVDRIIRLFRRQQEKEHVYEIKLFENMLICVLRLPWSLKEIKSIERNKIETYLEKRKSKYGIDSYYLPEVLLEISHANWCTKPPVRERDLFRCLFPMLLEELLAEGKNDLSELNVVIIHDQDDRELERIIAWISPKVKYLSIVTNEKDNAQRIADRAFEEYGLCIGVSVDFKSGLKDADIIMNIADLKEFNTPMRISPKAWVFNLHSADTARAFAGSRVFNGIKIRLPPSVLQQMDKEIMRCYKAEEIAYMLMTERVFEAENAFSSGVGPDRQDIIFSEFRKCGFSTAGYVGRYGDIHVANS